MGAWIETPAAARIAISRATSHPSWVRGLKLVFLHLRHDLIPVAPFMGAWIETSRPYRDMT